MKKIIYYFSGTGNSLYLGKEIKEKCNYELVDISKLITQDKIILEGHVGIIFPIYAMGIPRILETFLKKCKIKNLEYLFTIATCGSKGYGIPFKQIEKILNCKIDYSQYCHMPDNYLKLFKPPTKEKALEEFQEINKNINIILNHIEFLHKFSPKHIPGTSILYSGIYKFWRLGLKKSYKSFHVNDKCTQCGICINLCPTKNISLVNNKITWDKNCEECLACVNLCPFLAITCGGKSKKHSLRYKNPFISIEELKK
ncbi:MAG: EFR1 family ferrodoxin [Cetobacterium sp.]